MNIALLFLFAVEMALYSLLWHNQSAQSPGRECPRNWEQNPLCRWLRGDGRKPAVGGKTLDQLERRQP